jgi:hypothetical protein
LACVIEAAGRAGGLCRFKKQNFAPKLLVTDKLGSYGSGFRQLRLTIGAAEKQSR